MKAQKKQIVLISCISIIVLIFSIVFFIQKVKQKTANKDLVKRNLDIVESEKRLINIKKDQEILIKALKDKNVSIEPPKLSQNRSGYILPESHKQELIDKIVYLFEEEKIYTQKDITSDKLCKMLNTNRTYASKVINEYFNKSFSDLLNEYRVKEARRLLSDFQHKNYSIEGIAELVGFSSPATFYRAFKKFVGVTTSFYIKSLESKRS